MDADFLFHLKALSRCIYYVTEEEDRFIKTFAAKMQKNLNKIYVFSSSMGMVPVSNYMTDWTSHTHTPNESCQNIHQALLQICKESSPSPQGYYIITDPEQWLKDGMVQRRILDLIHQENNDLTALKVLIFVGSIRYIPPKLARYFEVIQDTGMDRDELEKLIVEASTNLKLPPPPPNFEDLFRGLTSYEATSAIAQSYTLTKNDGKGKRIDPAAVTSFRRRQIRKTDLVQLIDTSKFSFDVVGGVPRFKEWAKETSAVWTEEGRAFGLEHPRGILAMGVWGTGKSLSIKSLGNEWGLPVVQLEMGRLRSSGVGESEANVYRALSIIESASPCLVWIDEAEKSLAGTQSSAQSDAGTTARTIGILSTWIQETNARVCLALTANTLATLPVEFVNRMDASFFFSLPQKDERIEILKIHLRKRKQDPDQFNLSELADAAEDMVGREIEQSIRAALVKSFHKGKGSFEALLMEELKTKPRIVKTMEDELRTVKEWVGYDPEANDGIRARYASEPPQKGPAKGSMKVL